ncbi:M-phase phosphoprotein 8 [Patella vulgata]|uniref:M-phase phosphoprotein 8 n=1 Tax=Patella vulgata TaxID=6465 RepID=UPI00217F4219|nr:M-phase phosphoprotein 8 [Patella vulgata]
MAEDVEGVPAEGKIMDEEGSISSFESKNEDEEVEEELFDVEKIVGMSKNGGKSLYKVRWRGYPPSHDTWEPVENLASCLDMIEDFDAMREESRRKRAEERKKKQAIMEGRLQEDVSYSPISSQTTPESSSPFMIDENPETTLKDTFWKDLEEGKVNLFATDMYSKVKGQGRASRPTSFKQIFNNSKCTSPTPETQSSSSGRRKSDSSASKKRSKGKKSPLSKKVSPKTVNGRKTRKAVKSLSYKEVAESDHISNDSNDSAITRSSMSSDISVATPQSVSSENPSSEFDSGVFDSSLNKTCDSPEDRKQTISENKLSLLPDSSERSKRRTPQRSSPRSYTEIISTKSATRQRRDCEQDQVAHKRTKLDSLKLTKQSSPLEQSCNVVTNFISGKENLAETRQNIVSHLSDFNSSRSKVHKVDSSQTLDKNAHFSNIRLKNEFTQPLEKLLSGSLLNLLPDTKGQDEGCDIGFEIDLDEVDLDDMDRQMSFSPSSNPAELTDDELKQAVLDGDYDLVKRAFSSMTSYDLEQPDESGNTLLMQAVLNSYDDICELLVYHGAKLNAQNKSGCTALMLACEKCDICTLALLIEIGANMNIQQPTGETGLIKAVKRGHKQICQCLLENGANFALTTNNGYSALTYAKTMRHFDVEDIMIDHISRLTTEFDRQVALTLNNTARIITALFPLQCFPLNEGNKFVIDFKHVMEPLHPGVGFLLFISHARIKHNDIRCRLYGPCAVTGVVLNGVRQPTLTENSNFVLSCHPLLPGKNELCIHTESAPASKAKLVVCAYKAQLMVT